MFSSAALLSFHQWSVNTNIRLTLIRERSLRLMCVFVLWRQHWAAASVFHTSSITHRQTLTAHLKDVSCRSDLTHTAVITWENSRRRTNSCSSADVVPTRTPVKIGDSGSGGSSFISTYFFIKMLEIQMSNFFLRFWKVKPIWPRNNKNANLLTIILPCFPPLISATVSQ